MKHTPGPWMTAKYSRKRFGLGNPGGSAWALIQPIYTDTDDPEMIANARLIAAAPDMLKLLKGTLRYLRASGNRAKGLQGDISALLEKIGEENLNEP